MAQFPLQLLGTRCGHHDRLERHGRLRQHEIDGRRFARGHAHRLRHRGVPDEPHLQRVAPRRDAWDAILPVLPRATGEVGAQDQNFSTRHRLLRDAVRHPPGDRALLGGSRRHDAAEQRDPACDTDQLPNRWNVHRSVLIRRKRFTRQQHDVPGRRLWSVCRE